MRHGFRYYIADIITVLRIIFSAALIFTTFGTLKFYVLYSFAGISDMVDGMAARYFMTESRRGATLDSAADLVFVAAVFLSLIPTLRIIKGRWIIFIIIIAAIRISAYVIISFRFKRIGAHHTVLNKITGLILFLGVYFLNAHCMDAILLILCFISLVSSLEELAISIREDKYSPDIKSIFHLHN